MPSTTAREHGWLIISDTATPRFIARISTSTSTTPADAGGA
jgi:hypothetical protein